MQHASLTIRKLDPRLKRQLRMRAAEHGHSMEEEARQILRDSLTAEPTSSRNWVDSIRKRFATAGYVELEISEWDEVGPPPDLK